MLSNCFADQFQIGLDGPLQIRVEELSTRADACRLFYVSDIHLRRGRSEKLARQVIEAARASCVDAVLLGGDLVDSGSELAHLAGLVQGLSEMAPVLAVGGNHDRKVGFDRVRAAVEDGAGLWVHDKVYPLSHGARTILIAGPGAANACCTGAGGDVKVLCAHNPRVWKKAKVQGYDLVLAGHLHGCQAVAFAYRNRLYPGALFYPYCYLNHRHGRTRLVVSRGVSDLIPLRWRCPREVVVCHV